METNVASSFFPFSPICDCCTDSDIIVKFGLNRTAHANRSQNRRISEYHFFMKDTYIEGVPMFRAICTFTILAYLLTSPVLAQKSSTRADSATTAIGMSTDKSGARSQMMPPAAAPGESKAGFTPSSPGDLKLTPEMWFYEQNLRQYQDPKMAVRANAEFQAEQRQRRLAAMHWFGFSNSRPKVSADPFNGDYSPGWTSNNAAYPYRWSGFGPTVYVAQPIPYGVYSY
jgi:hypothetical protein